MCDYSAKSAKQRSAAKNDKLVSHSISTHTRGFVGVADTDTAVCLLPGTELAFDKRVEVDSARAQSGAGTVILPHTRAIFRQVDKLNEHTHHDTLEFADGSRVKLNLLVPGQRATVLQLPADPKTLEGEARKRAEAEQRRAAYA